MLVRSLARELGELSELLDLGRNGGADGHVLKGTQLCLKKDLHLNLWVNGIDFLRDANRTRLWIVRIV